MQDFEQKYTELLNATANMRRHQKAYFGCRTGQNLNAAKKAESKVDQIINAEVAKAVKLQQSMLFK